MTFLYLVNEVQDRWDKNSLGELYHKNYMIKYSWDSSGGGFKENTWDDFNPKDSILTFMFRILYYVIENIRDKTGIPPRFGLGRSASDALLKEPLTADDKEYLYDNYENAGEWILVRDFWVARKRIENPFPADNFNFLRRIYDIISRQYGASIEIEIERSDKAPLFEVTVPANLDAILEKMDKLQERIDRLEKKQGMIAEDINRRVTVLEDEKVRYDD
jgi:hypothetical protein